MQRLGERLAVVGLAAELLDRGLDALAGDVHAGRVAAGQHVVVLPHRGDEALVARRVEIGRIPRRRDDTDRLVAEAAQQRVVHRGPAGEQRNAALEAEIGIAAHELHRIRSGEAVEHAIDLADLRDIGRVIRRDERRPQLLDDLAAVVLEHALEARHLLVAESEVLGDRRRALVLELLGGVVAHDVAALRRGRRRADDERIGLALGHVLGGGEADQRGRVVADVVGDRQQLERRERAEDHVDLVALDQLLRLGLGARRIAAGVGGDELDLAAGERVRLLFEKNGEPLLHLDAALRQRAGLHRQQADLERSGLRDGRRDAELCGSGPGGSGRQKGTTIELARHDWSSRRTLLCPQPAAAAAFGAHHRSTSTTM